MYYAIIDTNIFIRVMSQGKPGCESNLFDDLRILVEGKSLSLLIPEVVELELEHHIRNLPQKLKKEFGEMKEIINKKQVWSEIQDAKHSILTQLDEMREIKMKTWQELHCKVVDFLKSEKVTSIPFTPEIMCRTKARIMRGGMPKSSLGKDQDAAIVESLVKYFSEIQDSEAVLFFCSENYTDFAIELTQQNSKDRSFALHPLLAEDLPRTHYFTQLSELLQFDKGYESLPLPPEDSEMQAAIERYEDIAEELDFDIDEHHEIWQNLHDLKNDRLAQEFSTRLLPELPEEFHKNRLRVIDSIKELLVRCRKCKSWDERSEYKLSQWIEHIPENMISYTSLSNLLRVEKNLTRYLSIHQEMDIDLTNK